MTMDPRWIEFSYAAQAVRKGLSADPGAHERYRHALLPYCELLAELSEPHVRKPMMLALFDDGIPLGIISLGFKATEAELAAVKDQPPTEPEPVDEIERLQRLPYRAYLKTPHWQQVRKAALERTEHRCSLCNDHEHQLEVHHRTYERRGAERPADVIVLCDSCHSRHHGTARAA
jgi:hypothetical protein